MGKRYLICKGDKTTHGGIVLEGSELFTIENRSVALVEHKVSCPLCKGIYPIVEGVTRMNVMGMNAALEGMKTACGAILIASQTQASVNE